MYKPFRQCGLLCGTNADPTNHFKVVLRHDAVWRAMPECAWQSGAVGWIYPSTAKRPNVEHTINYAIWKMSSGVANAWRDASGDLAAIWPYNFNAHKLSRSTALIAACQHACMHACWRARACFVGRITMGPRNVLKHESMHCRQGRI